MGAKGLRHVAVAIGVQRVEPGFVCIGLQVGVAVVKHLGARAERAAGLKLADPHALAAVALACGLLGCTAPGGKHIGVSQVPLLYGQGVVGDVTALQVHGRLHGLGLASG